MNSLPDHPLRHAMVAELHARPFPVLAAPCQVIYFAIKEPKDARKRDGDRVYLIALLDQFRPFVFGRSLISLGMAV
jgi:hypothetical protein